MIQLKFDGQWKELEKSVDAIGKNMPREIAKVLNKTTRVELREMNKQIRTKLNIKAKDVKKELKYAKKANKDSLSAEIVLDKGTRISLKRFGPRQGRKGTSYKIGKGKGRSTNKHAFMGPKPGVMATKLNGHVFRRKNIEDNKSEIVKLFGPSIWGVWVKNKMSVNQRMRIDKELLKQIREAIRVNVLRASGVIK